MSGEAVGYLGSALLGSAVALGLVAASAFAGARALRRGAEAYFATSVRGTVWRMAGALVGVALCLALRPPSTAAFTIAFLALYLAGHTLLALRFGAKLRQKGSHGG